MTEAANLLAERLGDSKASLRYALLFAEPAQRPALQTLAVLYSELRDIALRVSDPAVAHTKLGWWRAEIERALAGSAQHPLGPAIARLRDQHGVEAELLRQMADAVEIELNGGPFDSDAELNRYLYKSGGAVATAVATIAGAREPGTRHAAERLGFAMRRTTLLRDLRQDFDNGLICLPRQRLDAAGLGAETLLGEGSGEALRGVVEALATQANAEFEEGFSALPAAEQPRQRALCVMAALYRELLRQMRRDGWRVSEKRYQLSPLRKLWTAWRCAGRAARRAMR